MKRLLALLLLMPLLAFGEGSEAIKVGTQTRNVLSPLTINWTGTTLDFTGSTVSGLGGGVTLKTNGTTNGSQTLLNLQQGSNVTLTDNGLGQITIASTAGGSGTVTSVAVSGANGIGVSGSPITTSGTIALSLGAITPTSVNGNTITTGTGTLTLGSATLNAGAGGTLGSNAFTSTAYVPTSRTLTIGPTTSDLSANRTFLGNVTNDAQTTAAVVPNTAPSAGQILAGNAGGTAYAPVTLSGSGATATLSSAGLLTLSAIPNATLSNSAITIAGTSTSLGGSISLDTISGVSSNGFLKRTGANTWTNDSSTYLTGNQTITLSGDATGSGTTAITVANANLPDGVTQAGSLLLTDIAAPSSPAASHLKVFGDSTDLRFHDKNAAGTIGTTVVSDTGASNNFLTAISAAGVISKAQPSFTNISGSVAASQLPNPSATTLGGIESLASSTSKWINQISTSGVPSATQPAFSDISGNIATSQMNSGTSASSSTFWRGDGTWATPTGTGTVTSIATTSPITGGTITSTGTIALNVGVDHAFTAAQGITLTNATTNAVDNVLTLSHDSSGTAAASFGEGILLRLEDDTTNDQNAAQIATAWSTATHASHASYIDFQASTGGAALASVARLFGSGGLSVNSTSDPGAGIINANTGFRIANAAASGKILVGNGTNFVASTPTYPNASATSGKVIVSDGTNFVASTPTFPNASATTNKVIKSDGTNWVASTETYAAPGTSGNISQSDGTNWTSAINHGGWTEKYVSGSNATTTGQSLVDITGLVSDTLLNSTVYEIEANLSVTTSADSTGIKFGIHGGGTGTAATVTGVGVGPAANPNAAGASWNCSSIDTGGTTFSTVSGISGGVVFKGFVTTRSTGTATISIQFLKVTSGTATVNIGSVFRYRQAGQ